MHWSSPEKPVSLSTLEQWYASQCNGNWEHAYGIRIDTLDNPGWSIEVDLRDTPRQGDVVERTRIDRTKDDWIQYWTEKQQFRIACGPLNLSEAVELFVRWFNTE